MLWQKEDRDVRLRKLRMLLITNFLGSLPHPQTGLNKYVELRIRMKEWKYVSALTSLLPVCHLQASGFSMDPDIGVLCYTILLM